MIAAVETTGEACSVALIDGGSVLVHLHTVLPRRHDELLAAQFESMLKTAGIRAAGLQAVAVSAGPGSYTGIRIGLSFTVGLAMAASIPVVSVPTLDAMAYGARHVCTLAGVDRLVATVSAGRNGFYAAAYTVRPEFAPLGPPSVVAAGELAAFAGERALLTGCSDAGTLPMIRGLPTAVLVAEYGEHLFEQGLRCDATQIEPLYIAEYKV